MTVLSYAALSMLWHACAEHSALSPAPSRCEYERKRLPRWHCGALPGAAAGWQRARKPRSTVVPAAHPAPLSAVASRTHPTTIPSLALALILSLRAMGLVQSLSQEDRLAVSTNATIQPVTQRAHQWQRSQRAHDDTAEERQCSADADGVDVCVRVQERWRRLLKVRLAIGLGMEIHTKDQQWRERTAWNTCTAATQPGRRLSLTRVSVLSALLSVIDYQRRTHYCPQFAPVGSSLSSRLGSFVSFIPWPQR